MEKAPLLCCCGAERCRPSAGGLKRRRRRLPYEDAPPIMVSAALHFFAGHKNRVYLQLRQNRSTVVQASVEWFCVFDDSTLQDRERL